MPSLKAVRFLDWFGHVLDYDRETQRLIRRPLSEIVPEFYALARYPLENESRIVLRGSRFRPTEIPIVSVQKIGNYCALKNPEGNFLSINPRADAVGFWTDIAQDWEYFLSVTPQILQGLALFSGIYDIIDSKGREIAPLTLGDIDRNEGDIGILGACRFSLSAHLKSFERCSKKIELIDKAGETHTFLIQRKEDAP